MKQHQLISSSLGHNHSQMLQPLMKHQRQRKQLDRIKFVVMIVIFAVMSYLFLTFVQGVFDYSLKIWSVRIWKYLIAFFGGGALGLAGFLLQKITRNNLADVSILGIGSLNIIFITFYILKFYHDGVTDQQLVRQLLPLVTIGASIFGTSIIYGLAKLGNKSTERFIIIGIGLQFLFEGLSIALVNPSLSAAPGSKLNFVLSQIINFSLGKFPDVQHLATTPQWRTTTLGSVIAIVLILIVVYLLRQKIDLMEVNENLARSYGIKIELMKITIYGLVALLAGIEAAMIGTIALLGVLAPNLARLIFGNRSSTNIIASFLIGGLLVLLSSFISVNLATNIPIGFLSTAIVTPYFIYMIIRYRG